MAYPGLRPPPIDARQLRPKRGWYVVAGIIAGLSVLAAPVLVLLGIGALSSLPDELPTVEAEFDRQSPATVRLTADRGWAIYVADLSGATPSPSPDPEPEPSPEPIDSTCAVSAVDGGTVELVRISYYARIVVAGRAWHQLYELRVSQDGQYRVSCEPTDPAGPEPRFAVGEDTNIAGIMGRMFGGIGSFFGAFAVPCIGLLLGGLIALIVGLRRYLHRKRLQQQHAAHPPPGYPPARY